MTISEIRTILSQDDVAEELLQEILSDERKGVKTLVGSYMKRLERKSRERLRVESMYDVESRFYQEGLTHIVGIDEVGRGPLAGPVVAGAVNICQPGLGRFASGCQCCPDVMRSSYIPFRARRHTEPSL